MLEAVEMNCKQVPHATIGATKIYLNRMQVKYFEKLGLEMWGYACLPRQGRESGRRGTGVHLHARDLPEN